MLVFNNIKYISTIALCVVIFISVVLTGCIPVPDRAEDSSSGKDSIIFFSDSATENLLRALSRNDYKSFSKDFDKELLSIITVDKFNSVSNSFKSDLGDYVHHSIFLKPKDISEKEDVLYINYKADFLKNPDPRDTGSVRTYEVIIVVAFKVNNNEVKITDFRYFSLDLNICILC